MCGTFGMFCMYILNIGTLKKKILLEMFHVFTSGSVYSISSCTRLIHNQPTHKHERTQPTADTPTVNASYFNPLFPSLSVPLSYFHMSWVPSCFFEFICVFWILIMCLHEVTISQTGIA